MFIDPTTALELAAERRREVEREARIRRPAVAKLSRVRRGR
jgi:hypothetical protein